MVESKVGAERVGQWQFMRTCRDNSRPRSQPWFEVLSARSAKAPKAPGGRAGPNASEDIEDSDTESEYELAPGPTFRCPEGVIKGKGSKSVWVQGQKCDAEVDE